MEINILLIEDNKADVHLIHQLLKKSSNYSFKLDSCTRLSEGLSSLKAKNYDIVLLDLSLPDSNIESTVNRMLGIPLKIPVIVLTGLDDKDLALNTLKRGFQDYLIKGELNSNNLTRSILYGIERYKHEFEKERILDSITLDKKDMMILNILQDNYKISYKEISDKINLAASTIHNRVQNLINKGVIKKIDTIIDPLKVGYKAIAILSLYVDPLKLKEIAEKLLEYDEIQLVATSAGESNLILKLLVSDEKNLWRFINEKIKIIEGVNPDIKVSSFIDIYKMSHKIRFPLKK